MDRQKQILQQIDSLSSGGAAAQPAAGDQSGAATATPAPADNASASTGAPVQSGDANTDYNAAIALVQDKSRQEDALVAFRTSLRNTLIPLICPMRTIGWVS
jgi:TolA-binding protein